MYFLNEGSIDLPDDWYDQSINVISVAPPGTPGLTFTIARDLIPWGMEFTDYIANQLDKSHQALTNFDMLGKRALRVAADTPTGDTPAVEVECLWDSQFGPVHQIIQTTQNKQMALIVTASMKGRMNDTQLAQVRRVLATLSLKRPEV
ncbi:MAG: DcrB-related protein [Paracoccus sp. (in: a-proteobacteria)]|nr:DcrB-related protein [Paracoccus sp. (in: a-proteobacteria)]